MTNLTELPELSTTFTSIASGKHAGAKDLLDDLGMEGVLKAVTSTATLGEAVRLVEGYVLEASEKAETAAGYAKRTGHVDALIVLAKYDTNVSLLDIIEVARRSLDPKAQDKAENFIVARVTENETERERVMRSGRVETLIAIAEKSANITPLDVLINGLRSSDLDEQKKARDFFRAKTKFKPVKAAAEKPAPAIALVA